MALTYSRASELGALAPDFNLPGVDGKSYSLSSFDDCRALVVVFMCNHCPYVIAVQDRINALAREFASQGMSLVGINSNDAEKFPADNFEAMKHRAKEKSYAFPYLRDESQEVAKAYNAVCTPDFYAYRNQGDKKFVLSYRGRLDDNWKDESAVSRRELAEAVRAILLGNMPSLEQTPSMGCSIKWR